MRQLLLIGLAIFSAMTFGSGASAQPHDSTPASCAVFEVDLCKGEVEFSGPAGQANEEMVVALEGYVEKVLKELSEANPMFCAATSDEEAKKQLVCEVTDAVKRTINCYVEGAQARRQLTACFMSGDVYETNWGISLDLDIEGISIMKFLTGIRAKAKGQYGRSETDQIWHCLNTRTGEVLTGTLPDVQAQQRLWLRSIGEEE